jgi:hypothetical protein
MDAAREKGGVFAVGAERVGCAQEPSRCLRLLPEHRDSHPAFESFGDPEVITKVSTDGQAFGETALGLERVACPPGQPA